VLFKPSEVGAEDDSQPGASAHEQYTHLERQIRAMVAEMRQDDKNIFKSHILNLLGVQSSIKTLSIIILNNYACK
jgi:hypothetical protein